MIQVCEEQGLPFTVEHNRAYMLDNFSEKFAELIVRECIGIAQDRANFPGFPPNDVNDIIDEIREHFGVEE
jgi:hypothetical protein